MGNYKLTFMQRRYLLFIKVFFQYDPSNPPVGRNVLATVDFLMDGAELSNEPFTLKFVEDPVISSTVGEKVTFSTDPPCKKELINIQVKNQCLLP